MNINKIETAIKENMQGLNERDFIISKSSAFYQTKRYILYKFQNGLFLKHYKIENMGNMHFIYNQDILYTHDFLNGKNSSEEIKKRLENIEIPSKLDISKITKKFVGSFFIFISKSVNDRSYFINKLLPSLLAYNELKALKPETKLVLLEHENEFIKSIFNLLNIIPNDIIYLTNKKNKQALIGGKEIYFAETISPFKYFNDLKYLVKKTISENLKYYNHDEECENKNWESLIKIEGFTELSLINNMKQLIITFKSINTLITTMNQEILDSLYFMNEKSNIIIILNDTEINQLKINRWIKRCEKLSLNFYILYGETLENGMWSFDENLLLETIKDL